MKTHTCDICDIEFTSRPWMLIQARPSDPSEMVCCLLSCEKCGKEDNLASPSVQDEMERKIEEGELINGKRVLFSTFVQANW